jgi:hypothetical protein
MLSQSVSFTKPKTPASKYYKTPNTAIKINKSQTIADPKELVIKDYYIVPNIKEEYFVRTLYRFKPVSLKSPKCKKVKEAHFLPIIKYSRPFSSDVKYIKINILDKVILSNLD